MRLNTATSRIGVLVGILLLPGHVRAAHSSPRSGEEEEEDVRAADPRQHRHLEGSCYDTITFDEFPLRSPPITAQYQSRAGIHFSSGGNGDGGATAPPPPPFLVGDAWNPDAPVLSGTPLFEGSIQGSFVDPEAGTPTIVRSFRLDVAGSFGPAADASAQYGSVRLQWFDPEGTVLGQRTTTSVIDEDDTIVEAFEVSEEDGGGGAGGIASFAVEGFDFEGTSPPASFAVDNVSSCKVESSLVFRYDDDDDDHQDHHVGFHYYADDEVYECHPGYRGGAYVSGGEMTEYVVVKPLAGLQQQFTLATWEHNSPWYSDNDSTPSSQQSFKRLPLAADEAGLLQAELEEMLRDESLVTSYRDPDLSSLGAILRTLSPYAQKGGTDGSSFSAVGVLESVAEAVGLGHPPNNGQGFVPDFLESIEVDNGDGDGEDYRGEYSLPLLSPDLLYQYLSMKQAVTNTNTVIKGWFYDVDYVVVDPLGRRIGRVGAGMDFYDEIPLVIRTSQQQEDSVSGSHRMDAFVIADRLPGTYTLEVEVGSDKTSGLWALEVMGLDALSLNGTLVGSVRADGGAAASDERTYTASIKVPATVGGKGDLDGDGDVTKEDRDVLLGLLDTFADGLVHPGDFNADGVLDQQDLDLFDQLTGVFPIVQNDGYVVDFDQSFVSAASVLDNDIGGSDLIATTKKTPPQHGVASVSSEGIVTYMPDVDWCGTDSFHYKATNSDKVGSAVGKITIVVKCVSDPVALDDAYATKDDYSMLEVLPSKGLLANDSSPDGHTLKIASYTQPIGKLNLNKKDGSFRYHPKRLTVKDAFEYTVEDGEGGTATARVTIEVGDNRRDAGNTCFDPITFAELPLKTVVSREYQARGVWFDGGDSWSPRPFIVNDAHNPTSPALSGQPAFKGTIAGAFVDPTTGDPVVVGAFALDAGYLGDIRQTRLLWYDPHGNVIGQQTNSGKGIKRLVVEGGNVAGFSVDANDGESLGFAIDNLVSCRVTSSIAFREDDDGRNDDGILGFNHVGFNLDGIVYEVHPGYREGTYTDADAVESVFVSRISGVQQQFTLKTFAHESFFPHSSPVHDFRQIPINDPDALAIKNAVERIMRGRSAYRSVDISTLDSIERTLSPWAQKGGNDNTFTAVGLIEAAAEKAGGQGFIPDELEVIEVDDHVLPLLSPQLLYQYMSMKQLVVGWSNVIKGWFYNADYIVTDPLGRRIGSTSEDSYDEVPLTIRTGEGRIKFFIIADRLPGTYTIEVIGNGDEIGLGAFQASGVVNGTVVGTVEDDGDSFTSTVKVPTTVRGKGDLNGDGDTTLADRDILIQRLYNFTDGRDDPGDINGDGILDRLDLNLFDELSDLFPWAADDVYTTVDESTPLFVDALAGLLKNDVAREGDSLRIVRYTRPEGNLDVDKEGSFSYTPLKDTCGETDTFEYTIIDGTQTEATARVSIHVRDTTVPKIDCKKTVSASIWSPIPSIVDSVSDSCGDVQVTQSPVRLFEPGTVLVTATATDTSGNEAKCTTRVVVTRTRIRSICAKVSTFCNTKKKCCKGLACRKRRSGGKVVQRCVKLCSNEDAGCQSNKCCDGLVCRKRRSGGKTVPKCVKPTCKKFGGDCASGKCCGSLSCQRAKTASGAIAYTCVKPLCRELEDDCSNAQCCGDLACRKKGVDEQGNALQKCQKKPVACTKIGSGCSITKCCQGLRCAVKGVNAKGKAIRKCEKDDGTGCLRNRALCENIPRQCCGPLRCLAKAGWKQKRCILGRN